MKLQCYLVAITVATLSFSPSFGEGHTFPGVGENKKWEEASTVFNQGIVSYRAKDYSKAIEKYKQAIQIYPHDYEFYNNLGLTYKQNKQFDLAVDALKESIKLKPNVWESWSNLGSVYKHQKKLQEAIDAYSKAVEYNPPASKKTLVQQNITALKMELKNSASAAAPLSDPSAAPHVTP